MRYKRLKKDKKIYNGFISVKDMDCCTGCRICELICSLVHDGQCSSSLSKIHVEKDLFTGEYKIETCLQCKDYKCLSVCKMGAISIDKKTGIKVINPDICTGCKECEKACIFSNSRSRIVYDSKKNICKKCDLCGGDPECVKACPEKILIYNKRKI